MRCYYILRNKFWLWQGHTLFNPSRGKRIVTVYLKNGKQIRSNPNRYTDYSMDDPDWRKVNDFPELFI